ncbi:hypothetical protein CS542_02630 [Pedobacter sp. IW39]|nr:hypothetical protein CS542_02630 [Pedobacter sp. IW39]
MKNAIEAANMKDMHDLYQDYQRSALCLGGGRGITEGIDLDLTENLVRISRPNLLNRFRFGFVKQAVENAGGTRL